MNQFSLYFFIFFIQIFFTSFAEQNSIKSVFESDEKQELPLSSIYQNINASSIIRQFLFLKEYKNKSDLCSIMTLKGSDKGTRHNYTTLYSKLFYQYKNEPLAIFELGLGTNYLDVPSNMGASGKPGASLYGWAEYFPQSKIYGADIDKRILFQEPMISTFYCDQCDSQSIEEMFSNPELKDRLFDIIIDDGLHEFHANLTFLQSAITHLKSGGFYIVEDVSSKTASKFKKLIPKLRKGYHYVELVTIPTQENWDDNRLLVIQK